MERVRRTSQKIKRYDEESDYLDDVDMTSDSEAEEETHPDDVSDYEVKKPSSKKVKKENTLVDKNHAKTAERCRLSGSKKRKAEEEPEEVEIKEGVVPSSPATPQGKKPNMTGFPGLSMMMNSPGKNKDESISKSGQLPKGPAKLPPFRFGGSKLPGGPSRSISQAKPKESTPVESSPNRKSSSAPTSPANALNKKTASKLSASNKSPLKGYTLSGTSSAGLEGIDIDRILSSSQPITISSWDVDDMEKVVFVRINTDETCVDGKVDIPEDSYWWPAQLETPFSRLDASTWDVKLIPVNKGEWKKATVIKLPNKSEQNVRTFYFPSTKNVRFKDRSQANVPDTITPASFTKLLNHAKDVCLKAGEDDDVMSNNDDEFSIVTVVAEGSATTKKRGRPSGSGKVASKNKGKKMAKKDVGAVDNEEEDELLLVADGDSDSDLDLNFESDNLQLNDKVYGPQGSGPRAKYLWPAIVETVNSPPPKKKSLGQTYNLLFFDGTKRKNLSRKLLYTIDDITASDEIDDRIGEIRSEPINKCVVHNARTREPTPSVDELDATPFDDLEIWQQMIYARPILHRVILGTYPPHNQDVDGPATFRRHDEFLAGGERMNKLANQVGAYGGLTQDEVESIILPELERWMDGCDKTHRPMGDLSYESLSPAQRVSYRVDVLFPEFLNEFTILHNRLREGNETVSAMTDESIQLEIWNEAWEMRGETVEVMDFSWIYDVSGVVETRKRAKKELARAGAGEGTEGKWKTSTGSGRITKAPNKY